ncbi:MAG: DUF362 domain-containing protein [Candidatus Cloacimonetes bacterium]|nr:DUF362 domain-containing protein [Candidatus Cloacimonadota bacterium]
MKIHIAQIKEYDSIVIRQFMAEAADKDDLWQQLQDCHNILIKPNLLGPYPPSAAITTHPAVLESLILLLREHGKEVWLGDSPGGTNPVNRVWQATGIKDLAEKYSCQLLNFSSGNVRIIKQGNIEFSLTDYFWQADAIISVGKYKTHSLMYYTGAVKNLYGLIPGLKKSDYHKYYPDNASFSRVLASLYEICRQRFIYSFVDGIWGMEGEGPSAGIPRNFGTMFASLSAAALDWTAARMMGYDPGRISYLAATLQMDDLQPSDLEVEDKWRDFIFPDVKIKGISRLIKFLAHSPAFLKNSFRRIYRYYPDFNENCKLCGVCVTSCPVQAIRMEGTGSTPVIDYKTCIKCLCCHEVCPYHAVYIKKSLLAKFLIK